MTTTERRDLRDDLKSEIDWANEEIESARDQIKDLLEDIKAAKATKAAARVRLAELRAK